MATHKSALKEHRQSIKRRDRNRMHRARMRTAVKNLRAALDPETQDLEGVRKLLTPTLAIIDRSAKLGAVGDAAASRTKSRLQRAANKVLA